MDQLIGLIAIVLFVGSLISGMDVVPGCIGSLVIAALLYIPIYLIKTHWQVVGIILILVIGIYILNLVINSRKDKRYRECIESYEKAVAEGANKGTVYKELIQALNDKNVRYSKEQLESQVKDINNKYLTPEEIEKGEKEKAELDKSLETSEMMWAMSAEERNLVHNLKSKKDLTIESLIKAYRNIKGIKPGEDFNEYEKTTIKNMLFILSVDENEKQIPYIIKTILKEELTEHKKVVEKKTGFLKKEGIFIYIEKFIITVTMKMDMGEMDGQIYREKLHDLKRLLELKSACTPSIREIKEIIDLLKDQIYRNYFIDKLDYSKTKKVNEVVQNYINLLGNQWDKDFNIGELSKLINLDKANTIEKIKEIKEEMRIEYETLQFEKELLQQNLVKRLEEIDKLNGYEFEDYLVELFSALGYDVLPTSYSGDQGADLILQDPARKIVIQAKNYSGNVGNKSVQEALAAKHHYACDTAIVITNSYFTKQAQELAATTQVILIDRDRLGEIIEQGRIAFLRYL